MRALWVLLAIIGIIEQIGLIRLGAGVRYGEDGLRLWLIAGPVRVTLYPRSKPKKDKKARKKKGEKKPKKQKEPPDGQEDAGGRLPPVMELLPLAAEAAGALPRLIRIDDLTLHLTWGAEDPMRAALGFGRANAVMGMLWPIIDQNFRVVRHDVGVAVDYNRPKPGIFIRAALTASVGQLVIFGVRFGIKFLKLMRGSKRAKGNKEAQS